MELSVNTHMRSHTHTVYHPVSICLVVSFSFSNGQYTCAILTFRSLLFIHRIRAYLCRVLVWIRRKSLFGIFKSSMNSPFKRTLDLLANFVLINSLRLQLSFRVLCWFFQLAYWNVQLNLILIKILSVCCSNFLLKSVHFWNLCIFGIRTGIIHSISENGQTIWWSWIDFGYTD